MADQSSFKSGSANANTQNKVSDDDKNRKDEYGGNYKCASEGVGEEEKWGTSANPVKDEPVPAKNLKGVGG